MHIVIKDEFTDDMTCTETILLAKFARHVSEPLGGVVESVPTNEFNTFSPMHETFVLDMGLV